MKHARHKVNTSITSNKDKEKQHPNPAALKAKYVSPYILDAQRKARERAKKSKGMYLHVCAF